MLDKLQNDPPPQMRPKPLSISWEGMEFESMETDLAEDESMEVESVEDDLAEDESIEVESVEDASME